jgi:hypothetical protein
MIRSTVQRGTRIPAAADAPTSEPRTRNLARSHPRRQRTSSSRQRFQRRHRGQPRPRWSEDLGCRRQRCHAVHIDVNARWAIEADRDAGRATDSGCDGRCARRGDARSARRAVYGPRPSRRARSSRWVRRRRSNSIPFRVCCAWFSSVSAAIRKGLRQIDRVCEVGAPIESTSAPDECMCGDEFLAR